MGLDPREMMRFRVGACVRRKEGPDKLYQISKVDGKHIMLDGLWHEMEGFEIVHHAIKPGDRVRYISGKRLEPQLKYKKVYEVKQVFSNGSIAVENGCYDPIYFEKVEDASMDDETEFEVGSRVRCINVALSGELSYKKVYTVKASDERGVKVIEGGHWYDPSRFVRVEVQDMWRPSNELPSDGQQVVCITQYADLFQGQFCAEKERIENHNLDKLCLDWDDVVSWTLHPHKQDTPAEILSNALGGQWVQQEDNEDHYACGDWYVKLTTTHLSFQRRGRQEGHLGLWINVHGNCELHLKSMVEDLRTELMSMRDSIDSLLE